MNWAMNQRKILFYEISNIHAVPSATSTRSEITSKNHQLSLSHDMSLLLMNISVWIYGQIRFHSENLYSEIKSFQRKIKIKMKWSECWAWSNLNIRHYSGIIFALYTRIKFPFCLTLNEEKKMCKNLRLYKRDTRYFVVVKRVADLHPKSFSTK